MSENIAMLYQPVWIDRNSNTCVCCNVRLSLSYNAYQVPRLVSVKVHTRTLLIIILYKLINYILYYLMYHTSCECDVMWCNTPSFLIIRFFTRKTMKIMRTVILQIAKSPKCSTRRRNASDPSTPLIPPWTIWAWVPRGITKQDHRRTRPRPVRPPTRAVRTVRSLAAAVPFPERDLERALVLDQDPIMHPVQVPLQVPFPETVPPPMQLQRHSCNAAPRRH